MHDTFSEEFDIDFKEIIRHEPGRRVFWRLITECGTFATNFDNDPLRHAYNTGVRSFGLKLYNEISEKHPVYFDMMIQESRINHIE